MRRCAPRTLAISSGHADADGGGLVAWASAVADAGADAIQLREKHLGIRRLLALAQRLADRVPSTVALLVNGRLDVAIAAGAAGAHLPANGLPLARLRSRFPDVLLGVYTHRYDEVAAAAAEGADYVVFGPVFAPTSKDSTTPPVGLSELARVSRRGVPVLALGGVALERLPAIASAGAAGVAAIGAFQPPHDARALVAAAHRLFAPAVGSRAARPEPAAS